MRPMLGWEVVKGKEHFFIFLQAFAGFWEFDLVTGDELIVSRQNGFASRRQVHFMDQLLSFALNTLRHFIQDIGALRSRICNTCSGRNASVNNPNRSSMWYALHEFHEFE